MKEFQKNDIKAHDNSTFLDFQRLKQPQMTAEGFACSLTLSQIPTRNII